MCQIDFRNNESSWQKTAVFARSSLCICKKNSGLRKCTGRLIVCYNRILNIDTINLFLYKTCEGLGDPAAAEVLTANTCRSVVHVYR